MYASYSSVKLPNKSILLIQANLEMLQHNSTFGGYGNKHDHG